MAWIGGTIEREVTFRDTNGTLADPSTVTATAKDPSGNSTPADTIINVSTGVYDVLWIGDEAGLWFYRIVGTGNGVDAVYEGSFCVKASSVV